MKVNPRTNYPVRVRPRQWEEDGPSGRFSVGSYDLVLNTMVTVTFIPDLGTTAIDATRVKIDSSAVETPQEARLTDER